MRARRAAWHYVLGCLGLLVIAPLLAFALFTAGYFVLGRDYSIKLPNGYLLSRPYEGLVGLSAPNSEVIVGGNIDGYRVYKDVIVGHVSDEGLREWDKPWSHPGYFIVDMRTGNVAQGLTKGQWLAALRRHGISSKPALHTPSRWDNSIYRRYTVP